MSSFHHVFVFLMLFLGVTVMRVDGKQRTFELNISKGPWAIDCNQGDQDVMMVNGQHPGPAIRATLNDEIHVVVRNHGNEPTTVHYHGIYQIDTTESDGMPNVTQHEIQPGGEFHHYFRLIGQSGTFFYHAHVDLQDDSVQGPFIVYPTEDAWPANVNGGEELEKRDDNRHGLKLVDGPYHYDDERIVQLSEWWAQDPKDRLDYYLGEDYQGFIPADQYLINGRAGSTTSQKEDQQQQESCPGMAAVEVAHGKVYRVRVIGALSFATLGFSVAKHKMTIIEMDGELIEPYETTYLEVSSGQRYSVLLEATQSPGSSYNMDVQPFWITNTTVSGRAILSYEGGTGKKTRMDLAKHCPKEFALTTQHAATDPTVPIFPEPVNQWIFQSVKPLREEKNRMDFKAKPDRTIVLMPKEHLMGKGNTTRWLINNRHMPVYDTPLLEQLKQGVQGDNHHERRSFMRRGMNATAMKLNKDGNWDGYDEDMKTYPMQHGEVVDVVIHTTTLINQGICAGHPWHSHGFAHYPIAHGLGEYNHETDQSLRTYEHPPAKDTTFVYPGTTALASEAGIPCGWTKVRIYANNPGLWAFHCHITGHMLQGMMVIVEMAADQIKYLEQ